ncbi:MAG: hypothetical protein GC152_08370 [Alphaproteobacteria bacterium]|nr:hypothetical protein [Alphaproteobacteria bacterium]
MSPILPLTLAHLLVFVYWLGGDVGAFHVATFLTKDDVPADRRLFAARLLGDIDMAPRTSLVLAFPTGLALAVAKGWIAVPPLLVAALFGAAIFWLAIVWRLHLSSGDGWLRSLDLAIRWVVLAALAAFGVASLAGLAPAPTFIALKCLALCVAIACGIAIRKVATPLGPALANLAVGEDANALQEIRGILARARPLVLLIWAMLIIAASLGVAKPG